MTVRRIAAVMVVASLTWQMAESANAQTPASSQNIISDLDLAKASQNPLANLAGLPIRWNIYPQVSAQPGGSPDSGTGLGQSNPFRGTLNTIDVNPVVPFPLDNGWLFLARWKQPISWANDVYQPNAREFGLGDANPSVYLTPGPVGDLTLGLGVAAQLPTATNYYLGQGKWAGGPALVGIWTPGPFVLGALAQNLWSFAGPSSRANVNAASFQPLFNYNIRDGWFVVSQPYITADWTAPAGQRWMVPLGGGLGKLMKVGNQAFTVTAAAYGYPITPDGGPKYSFRFAMTFLFPR